MRWTIAILLVLASCSHCKKVELDIPTCFIEEKNTTLLPESDLACFWKVFQDPTLDALVQEALFNNYDAQIAFEKVLEARAAYFIELSKLLPTLDAFALIDRQRNSQTLTDSPFLGGTFFNFFRAGIAGEWELDIWDRKKDVALAAYYDTFSLVANQYGIRLLLAAEVVTTYLALLAYYEKIDIAKQEILNEMDAVAIAQDLYYAGLATEADIYYVQALLDRKEAYLADHEGELKKRIYTLALLLGKTPEAMAAFLCETRPLPLLEAPLPHLLPSELLCRRPDIRQAEFSMRAAGALVRASKKELFPTLTLGGFFTYASSSFRTLFRSDSRDWDAHAAFNLPLFHGGALYSSIEATTSRQRQAVLAFEKTVLTALQEVEVGFALYFSQQSQAREFARQQANYKKAAQLTEDRYACGLENYVRVIQRKREYYEASYFLVDTRQNELIALTNLYKSLGGGWECCSLP